jgi:hypothetical protein
MASSGTTLARGAVGLREVPFQSVTFTAPAGAVAPSIAAGATYPGGALLARVACVAADEPDPAADQVTA